MPGTSESDPSEHRPYGHTNVLLDVLRSVGSYVAESPDVPSPETVVPKQTLDDGHNRDQLNGDVPRVRWIPVYPLVFTNLTRDPRVPRPPEETGSRFPVRRRDRSLPPQYPCRPSVRRGLGARSHQFFFTWDHGLRTRRKSETGDNRYTGVTEGVTF